MVTNSQLAVKKDKSKELSESPFEFLYKIFRNVESETRAKTGDRYFVWSEHYDNWIDIIQPLLKIAPRNSLLIIRFVEFNRIMLWIQNCVYCGQYYSALRELRFLLEFILKALYLDQKYQNEKIESRIQEEEQLQGRRLISKLDLSDEQKNKLKSLYGRLSEYTHPTKKELAQLLAGKVDIHTTFAFNEAMFNKCVENTNEVVDSIFFIILDQFHEPIKGIKNNNTLIASFKKLGYKLTLSHIECLS